jgi:dihydroorotase
MEKHDLVLNLHGEWPGRLPSDGISLEEMFLPELKKLHERFPRLRCVLEVGESSLAYNAIVTHHSIALPLRLLMLYGLAVHQLLVSLSLIPISL